MRQVMKIMLAISTLGVITVGCTNSGNPVGPSDIQVSGALQYTFSTPKSAYKSGDTLTAIVTVHNSGSITDTIAVGDGIFEWALVNSSGDTAMIGGGANNLVELLPVPPNQSKQIYYVDRVLPGTGPTLVSGAYSLKATVRPMYFVLNLSIQ